MTCRERSLILPLTGLAVALHWLPAVSNALRFERPALAAGELTRVLSCHFTHYSFEHLFWSGGAFLVLGLACEARDRGRTARCLLAAAVAIPLAVYLFLPGMESYGGLSGLDSALWMLLGVNLFREGSRRQSRIAVALIAGFLGKTLFELVTGLTLFVDTAASSFVSVPLAHLVGAATGLYFGRK